MNIISNNLDLAKACAKLATEKVISIDTEFMRRDTYFPQLCLIQIASDSSQFIIDPLLEELELSPIKDLLHNDKIIKIFHAARQDFEVFYNLFQQLPRNIFDTQLAAEVVGDGKSLSYSNLCEKYLNIKIDKTFQAANWQVRPLPEKMLSYALLDAIYLQKIYEKLHSIINEKNLLADLSQLHNNLLSLSNYTCSAENAWHKIKFLNRSENFIEKMQVIASYREECAKSEDIPRLHFASDEDLIKICNHLPANIIEFYKLKLSKPFFAKPRYRDCLIELCIGLSESTNIVN